MVYGYLLNTFGLLACLAISIGWILLGVAPSAETIGSVAATVAAGAGSLSLLALMIYLVDDLRDPHRTSR